MASGGPVQTQVSPNTAAGMPPINTVGAPGPMTGPPTCGIGGNPGVCIGQVCKSFMRAAGGMLVIVCGLWFVVLYFRSLLIKLTIVYFQITNWRIGGLAHSFIFLFFHFLFLILTSDS
jgi:hypothetical protein